MRVTLVSREHPAGEYPGGIAEYAGIVGRLLARRGHAVTVVTRGVPARLRQDGVDVVRLSHPWLRNRTVSRLIALQRIAAVTMATRPDVVMAAEWQAEAWWLVRRHAVPVLTTLHTPTYIVEQLNGTFAPRRNSVLHRLEPDQARRSAALVSPSTSLARRLSADWSIPPERIEVIPNPLEVDVVVRDGARAAPVPLPETFVCFLGRLEPRKGAFVFAESLPAVLEEHPDVHVVFVGADTSPSGRSAGQRILELAAPHGDRVHLLGGLPRADAMAVTARAALVALPSLWENYPFTATEALALGRPVVGTYGTGYEDIVEPGRSGWLVPAGDARALGELLIGVLGDRPGLRAAGSEARARIEVLNRRAEDGLDQVFERLARRRVRGG